MLLFWAATAFLAPLATAAEPADSNIAGAVADLDRFEGQLSSGSTVSKSTANRTLKLLKLTRQRLDGSDHKADPSWTEANARYEALVAQLKAVLDGSAKVQSAPQSSASGATTSPPATTAPSTGETMISQQRVRIKKLKRDIESLSQTTDQNGAMPFQDGDYVARLEQRDAYFTEQLAKYDQFAADPDVEAAAGALQVLRNMIAFGKDHAAKELAALGDVQARLKAMDNAFPRVPQTPAYPYPGNAVPEWVASLAEVRKTSVEQYKELAEIKKRAYLPNNPGTVTQGAPYDAQDVRRLEHGYADNVRQIDSELTTFSTNIDAQVASNIGSVEAFEALDPTTEKGQYRLLGGNAEEDLPKMLKEHRWVAAVAMAFDKMLKREQLAAHKQVFERYNAALEALEATRAAALENVRMPEPDSDDDDLLEIARDTLARPDYEVGEVKRLVINAGLRHLEKETSETEFDDVDVSLSGTITLKGTETTYFYEWDEFQVATAEAMGDKFVIFYSTLKKYSRGGPTTPLNKWIIAQRIESLPILEKNIGE
ncbi:hypothetical protein EOI86_10230 [Hwanghaeella grinnelliae]|uniref:DUF3450 family protein n=1 Tax=Hwanghaeella grinnelliae TaxID=2500179 RepID=A0A3S2VTQ0_9PROT|nr:hypothetical protein [Hwanghaeella grinnelliae]RVU39579.1 hypothetical protein EOI86_10230 [Hwanghaeella grinnelliae]